MAKNDSDIRTAIDQTQAQLIIFRVSGQEFGVPIEIVKEIIKIGFITPIPDSPNFIKGLINVRGDVVAAIDLRARFFLKGHDDVKPKHIVIIQQVDSLLGLVVDEVSEVLRVEKEQIQPAPDLIKKIHENYVSGVFSHNERLIILLDLGAVLSEQELRKLAESAHGYTKEIENIQPEDIINVAEFSSPPNKEVKIKQEMAPPKPQISSNYKEKKDKT